MKLFDFNPQDYAAAYAEHGYVHISKGLSEEFQQVLTKQVEAYLQGELLAKFAIGDKQQSLYQFPTEDRCFEQLLDSVAEVTGLDRQKLVLSERHIKAYDANANPNPLAHKDRYASEVSVGFSVSVPPGSKLVLYPYDEVSVNAFNSSAELRSSLSPEQVPEVTLRSGRKVEIADEPRDVMMFRGNAIWHLRTQPANTTMVYLKLNTFNCDPLGEDPRTPAVRSESLRLLASPDEVLATLVPQIGRRVDFVEQRYTRQWQEVAAVVLWGEKAVWLDGWEFQLLRAIDGERTVSQVVHHASDGGDRTTCWEKLRGLAERGIVELSAAPAWAPFSVATHPQGFVDTVFETAGSP